MSKIFGNISIFALWLSASLCLLPETARSKQFDYVDVPHIWHKVTSASTSFCRIDSPNGVVEACATSYLVANASTRNAWSRNFTVILSSKLVTSSNENQIAFVIAHEISHLILNHPRSSYKNELEADFLAARITLRAGFDPLSSEQLFQSMQLNRVAGFPFSLISHPPKSKRMEVIRAAVLEEARLSASKISKLADVSER